MNCHQWTEAALQLQQPDRVPVFSCTEAQNQVYEILGKVGLHPMVRGIIRGACTTPQVANETGCDAHGADAVAAVRICQELSTG